MIKFQVCDRKGNVYKTFDSKNQAMKYKKELKAKGFVVPLTIVEVK